MSDSDYKDSDSSSDDLSHEDEPDEYIPYNNEGLSDGYKYEYGGLDTQADDSSDDGDAHHDDDDDATAANLMKERLYDYIAEERAHYKLIYDTILAYVIKNKIFISDVYQITDRLDDIQRFDDFHYDIYCTRPLEHANSITNELYLVVKDDPNLKKSVETLSMNTVVENEEFTIIFDTRFVAKIYALQRDRRSNSLIDISKIVSPIIVDNVQYLPTDIEIIELYHTIYTTGLQKNLETNMYKRWLLENPRKEDGTKEDGSKDDDSKDTSSKEDNSTCYERKKEELEAIKIAILKDFLRSRKDIIVLGPLAVDWILQDENICPKHDRIQLITTIPAKQLCDELDKYFNKLGRGYKINMSEELDLLLPRDFRTKRIIFSLSFNSKEKPFLEYFNSASFELVPAIIHADLTVANREVLLRFLFVDIWITKFIHAIGKMDDETYTRKLSRTEELIETVYKFKSTIDGVLGSYVDADIEKRIMLRNQDKKHWAYIPFDYMKRSESLRQIGRDKKK